MSVADLHHLFEGPGTADVAVLSNSLGTTLRMWDPQAAALAREARVLRYDMRGHGRSPVPPPPYTLADLGADLIALLDRHRIERASLCGVSLGGMVSMWVAAHAPERVRRLVLCSTSALMPPPAAWAERAALVRRSGMEAVADTVVARWFTPAFAAARPDVVAPIRADLAATPPDGYAACCEVVGAMDLRADLGSIRAATLVIGAAADPSTPPEHARAIAAGIPGARLVVLPQGAHLVNLETPDVVTALIAAHLGDGA
ncbi:MAG TPA: 3-oxoadipate enol-lactonase [Gaiellales bacterium]|jgi:3-oxoadipate enol-lactonase